MTAARTASARRARIDVSIVMPCLNEARSLGHCIGTAQQALAILRKRHRLTGEVVVADNGSTDGSQALARKLGARLVPVTRRGYGAALTGGFEGARGRYLVMGDADGSYNFIEAVPMIEALMKGADVCAGSRFRGGVAPGAMPLLNRYLGNPALTAIVNILFRAKVSDVNCGLRALTRNAFERLRLTGSGMEFVSEMIIKASLLGMRIDEVPATLSPDMRGRAPHMRPWRDGWRNLRYFFMLSPISLFVFPALVTGMVSLAVLGVAAAQWFGFMPFGGFFGNYWMILAGAGITLGHLAGIMGITAQFYSVQSGYRRPGRITAALAPVLTLETMLVTGMIALLAGIGVLGAVTFFWSTHGFEAIPNVFPAVIGTCLMIVGVQNMLGGFLLAIVLGNDANLLRSVSAAKVTRTEAEDRRPNRRGA